MPPKDNIIKPIPDTLNNVVDAIMKPAAPKQGQINRLRQSSALQPATSAQGVLDLGIEVQRDVNGIEMGVLENGMPYLTQRGLAVITGISRKEIYDITQQWEEHYDDAILTKDRLSFIKEYLFRNGYTERKLYVETKKDGTPHYAYPDIVCMALLEYYAFESKGAGDTALQNYRKLASYGLQKFIYEALGYTPADRWRYYHDRVSLLQNSAPDGFFIVFHEVTGLIVDLINADLAVSDKTIPDISVGRCWSDYWGANGMDNIHGNRQKYEHNYPTYYPQAASNPQLPWAYPEVALGEFRRWFRHEYLPTKFPKYILTKAHLLGGQEEAKKIANLYQPKQLPKK